MVLSKALIAMTFAAPAFGLRVHKRAHGNATAGGYVVTLGDSYSSGVGIFKKPEDYEGGDCLQDMKTIAGAQFANAEGMQSRNEACAGGEVPDAVEQFANLQRNYPSEAANGWDGSVIVFTIGGNDIRTHKGESWGDLLGSCIASFYGGCHEADENQVANFDALQASLEAFYTQVAQGAGKASIRVLGYPKLLRRGWHCIPVPGLSGGAADWADDMVDELNGRLSSAVSKVKGANRGLDIEFVDVGNYLTKGACSTSGQHVHAIVLNGLGLSPMTFHPHQRGYNEYYKALGNSLGRSMPPSQVPGGSLEPWQVESIFSKWDSRQAGKLSLDDILGMGGEDADVDVSRRLRALFSEADKNQDGELDLAEFQDFLTIVANAEESS